MPPIPSMQDDEIKGYFKYAAGDASRKTDQNICSPGVGMAFLMPIGRKLRGIRYILNNESFAALQRKSLKDLRGKSNRSVRG
jgi:hypothetical protein